MDGQTPASHGQGGSSEYDNSLPAAYTEKKEGPSRQEITKRAPLCCLNTTNGSAGQNRTEGGSTDPATMEMTPPAHLQGPAALPATAVPDASGIGGGSRAPAVQTKQDPPAGPLACTVVTPAQTASAKPDHNSAGKGGPAEPIPTKEGPLQVHRPAAPAPGLPRMEPPAAWITKKPAWNTKKHAARPGLWRACPYLRSRQPPVVQGDPPGRSLF